jgi:hypothetical protein
MTRSLRAVVLIIALAAPSAARADACTDAVLDYNSVLSKLLDAMQHFSTCIADSKGLDDCAGEFRRLDSAHSQYVSTVAMYVKQCR